MINIRRLKRPTKRSGYELKPKQETCVRGVIIINQNSFSVWVDKFTPKKPKRKVKK